MNTGVYPSQWIQKSIEEGYVRSKLTLPDMAVRQLQPASLDLRLGPVAHRLRCSFLPGQDSVEHKLEEYRMGPPIDLRDGAILERNRPFLIPLLERLDLPDEVRARANPKSSIGRLDVFTRVITDRSSRFDDIDRGYQGKLFLEVFSRTFTIQIQAEQSLNQLRVMEGDPRLDDNDILNRREPIVVSQDDDTSFTEIHVDSGLFLSLDLKGDEQGLIGYRAKRNSELLDLTSGASLDPDVFWEPVLREKNAPKLVLEPEEFYLLMSREAVAIPPDLAAEMSAYDPTSGELRTHYAGFFDPGFGYDPSGKKNGARAVLEVRAHDVPFVVEHGQRICKLGFETMREEPKMLYGDDIGSSYQSQNQFLSKFFLPAHTEQLRIPDAEPN